jgi:tetratricopeptide (TPR) repeat protein
MRYDKDGFPIPPDFDFRTDDSSEAGFPGAAASGGARQPSPARPSGGGSRKRMLLVAFVAAGLVPAIVGPELMPTIRRAVVEWSLERAAEREARSDVAGAVGDVSRALHWHGDDAELLCMRAMLRLENRDAAGALGDAERAAAMAPTAIQPLRVRALIHVVNANADAALADAGMVVELASRGDPDALNHRAYIRALVGRELPAALADTRGYILHLLDRQQEAIDQLNLAIDSMQQSRRQLALLAGRIDPVELARRQRALDHGLAVMFHHRGLACRAIGLEQQARQDLEIAGRKGFDPSRGIF